MSSQSLFKLLSGLPDQNHETDSAFKYQNISEFLNILNYESDIIYYDLGGRYKLDHAHLERKGRSPEGDVYRFTQADAGVARGTSSRPYMIIEGKYSENLPFDEDIEAYNHVLSEELSIKADAFNPDILVHLSNVSLVIHDDEGGATYDLREISKDDATEIFERLRAPEMLPRELAPSIKSGKTTSVNTEYFELDTVEYTQALQEVDEADSNIEKGDSFERLAVLLFSGIPFLNKRDRKLRTDTGEVDVIFEYIGSDRLTIFDDYSRFILSECKNWTDSVGSDQIRIFKDKLDEHRLDFGVFFARNGISGDTGADASKRVQDIFHDEEIAIIVISDYELQQIKRGVSFYKILDQKLYELRFSE